MYCTIVKKECKKIPRGREYRKIQWRAYDWDPLQGIWHQEDEVPRDLKHKWDIVLNKSFRENGKVKKQQHHIGTISYWDIVGGWHSGSIDERIEGYFKLKIMEELGISREDVAAERKKSVTFEDEPLREKIKVKFDEFQHQENYGVEYKKIDTLIYSKFQPIIDQVMKEYHKSEEYRYKVQNEKIRKAKEQEIEEKKKEAERKQKEYQEASWQARQESYKNYNYSFAGNSTEGGLTQEGKKLAEEIITIGYKQLAKKYHPDAGGSNEAFQELGDIKDKLMKLV